MPGRAQVGVGHPPKFSFVPRAASNRSYFVSWGGGSPLKYRVRTYTVGLRIVLVQIQSQGTNVHVQLRNRLVLVTAYFGDEVRLDPELQLLRSLQKHAFQRCNVPAPRARENEGVMTSNKGILWVIATYFPDQIFPVSGDACHQRS